MTTVVTLNEWQSNTIPASDPTPADLDLAATLSKEGRRKLDLRWLRSGQLEISSYSWVGVVHLSGLTIQVRPKFAGNELGVLQMLEYASGIGRLSQLRSERTLEAAGANLLDLFCILLAAEAAPIIRDGLMFDYVERNEALPALRGSLMFREQATRRFGQLDVLECRFDEFHADVLENQLLLAGLATAARICGLSETRRRLRRLERSVAELSSAGPLDAGHYRAQLVYSRRNERYRRAHTLSLLLLEHVGVADLFGAGQVRSFAFLLDMNDVFEAFMTTLIAEAFAVTEWQVVPQRKVHSVVRHRSGARYSAIIPDIVLAKSTEMVPFDCKYKLYGRGGKKISSEDIYQAFLYAYALAPKGDGGARAGIIFPAEQTAIGPELEVARLEGVASASLTGIGVGLVALLKAMGDRVAWTAAVEGVRSALDTVVGPPERQGAPQWLT